VYTFAAPGKAFVIQLTPNAVIDLSHNLPVADVKIKMLHDTSIKPYHAVYIDVILCELHY